MAGRRVKLGWKKPPEWDRFEAKVEENHGTAEGQAGRVLDRAWGQYRDDHPAEALANQLLEAAGYPGEPGQEKKSLLTRPPADESDRGKVWVYVHEETKAGMEAFASESGVQRHEVLRAVVCWYLEGPRIERVTRKLERAVPPAVDALEELGGESSIGAVERRTIRICQRLGDEFTQSDLEAAIRAENLDSEPSIEKYSERVLNRLEYRTHPDTDRLYIPAQKRERLERERARERRQAARETAESVLDTQEAAATDGGQEEGR